MRVCFECHCCYDDSEDYCVEESHPVLSQIRDGSPEITPGYRLDILLDSGIKGETYLAHQTESGGTCLIRILSADVETSRQFLSNAELAAAFFHHSVVDVYEAGYLNTGEVFVVSENAEGDTLRELLDAESVPRLLTTIQIVRQTAESLYALHSHGLIHGAINPDNIVLTTDAHNRLLVRVKDIDFGGVIGRSVMANKFLVDSALDVLKYFAPEQCSGSGPSLQADIYSLGIVLHEMLAGEPPFNASKAVGLIEQHRNQRPPEIKIDNFDLRMLLTHALSEALRKQPELRQHSANAFARQMRHIEQLGTHATVPPPAGTPRSATVFTSSTDPAKFVVNPPAAPKEAPREAYEDTAEPAADMIQPVTISVADVECGPIPEVSLESAAYVLPETIDLSVDEPIVQDPVVEETAEPIAPRPSRLKLLTEKLRSISPTLPKIGKGGPLHIVESTHKESVVGGSTPAEGLTVQAEPAKASPVRVRQVPKKIEWETPEDDIPSAAAVMEAFSAKPVTVSPLIQPEPAKAAAVPAKRVPKKIEWETPEDDIPSEAAVMEALSGAPISETPHVMNEQEMSAVEAARSERTKVEWKQPEDDIPSDAEVLEAFAGEPATEVSLIREETEMSALDLARVESFKIKWAEVEHDIPTEADVPKVLVLEPVTEIPAVHAEAAMAAVDVFRVEPATIEPEPISAAKAESWPLLTILTERPANDLPEILVVDQPIFQNALLGSTAEPKASRFSGLKALTEKLLSMAPSLPKMRTSEALHVVEFSYQPQEIPTEIPAVQPPSDFDQVREVPIMIEPDPVFAAKPARKPVPEMVEVKTSGEKVVEEKLQPATKRAPEIEVIELTCEPETPRRSRLKAIKRKLRAMEPPVILMPLIEEKVESKAPRRSRLKGLKKKLRSMIPSPQILVREENVEPNAPRRSRLKLLKRKLRSMAPIPQLPVCDPLAIVAPAIQELVQVQGEAAEVPIVLAEVEQSKVISVIIEPAMIDWAKLEDDIPSDAAVPELLTVEPLPEITAVTSRPEEAAVVRADSRRFTIGVEPSKATYVRPTRPKRVKPLPSAGTAATKESKVETDRRDPIFSAYYRTSSGRRRSAIVLGGLVVLLALGFVGRLVFSDGVSSDSQSDQAAAKQPNVPKSLPRNMKPHVEAPTIKTVKQPETSKQEEAVGTTTPPSRGSVPTRAVIDRDDDDDTAIRPQKAKTTLVSQNYGAMGAPLMSTLVISYGNGKVTSSIEPYRNNTVDNKRVSIPSKVADPGRPRVVKHSNVDK